MLILHKISEIRRVSTLSVTRSEWWYEWSGISRAERVARRARSSWQPAVTTLALLAAGALVTTAHRTQSARFRAAAHTADRWVSASTLRTVPFRVPLPWVIGVSCVSPEPSDLPHQQFYLVLPALLFSTSQDHSTQVSSFVSLSLCLAGLQDQTLRALHTSVASLTTMREYETSSNNQHEADESHNKDIYIYYLRTWYPLQISKEMYQFIDQWM